MKTNIKVEFKDAVEIRVLKTNKHSVELDVRVGHNPWERRTLYRDDNMRIDLKYDGEFS